MHVHMHMLRWLVRAFLPPLSLMTWYPSSELLLDPSPLRVSDSLPGQLARSTARELALQRSRAPRPFATRGASPGAAGFALAIANEAWNLLLNQSIPMGDEVYPVDAPAGVVYRLQGSITWRSKSPPPFDVEQTVVTDSLWGGAIFSVAAFQVVSTFAGGDTATFQGVGLDRQLPGESREIVIDGGRNIAFWTLVSVNSITLTRQDSPLVLIPSSLPQTTQPQPDDTPDNDQQFPILLPGGIPGLLLPTPITILIPRPSDLGRRPVPVLFPTSIPGVNREELPQVWLTPEGIQVGTGGQNDPIVLTPSDTITNITNITQVQDFRLRTPPTVTTCTADPEPPVDCCDCEEIRQIVIEELDSKFPPSRPFSNEVISLLAAESRTFVLPEFTQWVELTIVQPPPNRRSQFGGADGQTVYYNGWYSFGVTGSTSERYPFHYDFMSIPIPKGVEAFTYTVYAGGTASGRIGYQLPSSL
jgi:hypothetical protein